MNQGLLDFLQSASNMVSSNIAGPVDLLGMGLNKIGVPVGNAPIGGTEWMKRQGLMRDVQQGPARVLGETAGLLGPAMVSNFAPQIAKGLLQAEANAAKPAVLRKESGMFIGPSAKTWDEAAAKQAQTLAARGTDPRQIWAETGTFKGPDGKWRQEIDDSAAALTNSRLPTKYIDGYGDMEAFKIKDALSHKGLFDSYPDLASIESSFMRGERGANYKPGLDWISFSEDFKTPLFSQAQKESIGRANAALQAHHANPRVKRFNKTLDGLLDGTNDRFDAFFNKWGGPRIEAENKALARAANNARAEAFQSPGGGNALGNAIGIDGKSVSIHELQHAIQKREGFAIGGSPDSAAMPELRDINKKLSWVAKEIDSIKEMQFSPGVKPELVKDQLHRLDSMYKGLLNDRANINHFDTYKRLAGEAEARATQARIPLNAAQRRGLFPLDSYDVPLDQLIIRGQ